MTWLLLAGLAVAAPRGKVVVDDAVEPMWDVGEADAVKLEIIEVFIENEAYDQALSAIAIVRADGLDAPDLDYLQARALIGKGLAGDAVSLLDDQYERDPERNRVLCLAYMHLSEVAQAEVACRKALKHTGRNANSQRVAELHNNLGFVLAAQGNYKAAIDEYREALELDPSLSRARNNLGFAEAALGRDDAALNSFRAALSPSYTDPDLIEAEAWYNLAVAQTLRGDIQHARVSYNHVLELVPGHARALQAIQDLTPNNKETP